MILSNRKYFIFLSPWPLREIKVESLDELTKMKRVFKKFYLK